MTKSSDKNNQLKGYLLLFVVFQGINLGLSLYSLVDSYILNYFLIIKLIDMFLIALVIFFFLKRNKIFINLFIASTSFTVLVCVLELIIYYPLFVVGGISTFIAAIITILFSLVMLYFWLNYFKNNYMLKIYLNTKPVNKSRDKDKEKRLKKAKRMFKVLK